LAVTPAAGPFLSLREATFRLGDRLVFENTSWVFHRREHWAIIGANGSGKSLLADALRGRVPLVRGELRYHFRPPPGLSHEEAIGHVSFEARKHEVHDTVVQSRWNSLEEEGALRVKEYLSCERVMEINPFEVSPRLEGWGGFERRRRKAVALLDVEAFLERTLLSLSNGERQRVELARALCRPLRLLILDEPFVGLDAAAREHFGKALARLMGTSLRVVLITTRLEDLPRSVTHVLCVNDCRVAAAGPRAEELRGKRRLPVAVPWFRPARSQRPPRRPEAAGPELVRLRHVTVRYGKAAILQDINWTVRAGESWALLGPNGAGKTTLLSLLLGDNPQAYTNDVVVFGKRRGSGESVWEIKRRIGWVSPELHLHFNDSAACLDVVASGFRDTIGLFEPSTPQERRAARERLAQFGLLEFARAPLFALSAGLQRMVLLARALVKKPELLILDEPCQGLDPAHRSEFIRTLDALLKSGGVTAIYVTHRPDEIPQSIRRVLRLSRGRTGRAFPSDSQSATFAALRDSANNNSPIF
jgi:molybdate transport system ATP-binding protein